MNEQHILMQKIRANGVHDQEVINAIMQINRDVFLPPQFRNRAFDDSAIPIAHGQTISQPSIVGMMTQLLMPLQGHKILEIGTGSGYQSIILSLLSRRVYSIERIKSLLKTAEEKFTYFKRTNITTKWADGCDGWTEQAPFARILVTAAAQSDMISILCTQLDNNGRMVIPIAEHGNKQYLEIIEKKDGQIKKRRHWAVRFVPLLSGKIEI